jgi:hypothetical protein
VTLLTRQGEHHYHSAMGAFDGLRGGQISSGCEWCSESSVERPKGKRLGWVMGREERSELTRTRLGESYRYDRLVGRWALPRIWPASGHGRGRGRESRRVPLCRWHLALGTWHLVQSSCASQRHTRHPGTARGPRRHLTTYLMSRLIHTNHASQVRAQLHPLPPHRRVLQHAHQPPRDPPRGVWRAQHRLLGRPVAVRAALPRAIPYWDREFRVPCELEVGVAVDG